MKYSFFSTLLKVLAFSVILFGYQTIYAQITQQRYVTIAKMWNEFQNGGGGGWESTWIWPGARVREKLVGEYRVMNATAREFAEITGVQNWTDKNGKVWTSYLAPFNPSSTGGVGDGTGWNGPITVILKRPLPKIVVDGRTVQQYPQMIVDKIDPTLKCDAEVVTSHNFAIGLTMKRTVYIYAPQNDKSNSYIYYDYWFINTGKDVYDSLAFPGQTLHNLGISFNWRPMVAFEGATEYGRIWEATNDDWTDYYGANYQEYVGGGSPLNPAGNSSADSLRLWMDWDGTPPSPAIDDIGDPDKNSGFAEQTPGHGRLLSYQWLGSGILWADQNFDNHSNDLSQPFTTTWAHAGRGPKVYPMDPWYNFLFDGKHSPTSVDMYCPDPPSCTQGDPTDPSTVAAPYPYQSIGIYKDLPFGDSVHVVMAVAVNGISSEEAVKAGLLWWQHENGGPGLTDAQKDSIVATGRDSLLQAYSLANKRFFNNIAAGRDWYAAPATPPSPDISISSSEQSNIISWSDVSQIPNSDTGVDDFAGYRVRRRQVSEDSTWRIIWDSKVAGTPKATTYIDSNVTRGFAYQYAVTSYNNGSQNWRNPGKSLESSMYENMTPKNDPVHPFLGASKTLSKIRVVPNPFNTKSAPLNYPGEPNKIMFVGLPGECTIKIFTVTGDLVKTLDHTNGTSQESWNQISDYNQLITTGVYIYVVESNIGKAMGKFVVVRN